MTHFDIGVKYSLRHGVFCLAAIFGLPPELPCLEIFPFAEEIRHHDIVVAQTGFICVSHVTRIIQNGFRF